MKYHVKLMDSTHPIISSTHIDVVLDCKDLEELKTRFLRRFGNVIGTNKQERQRLLVKQIVYTSNSVESLVERVNDETRWKLSVTEVE